jgi:sugar/nucleoside kinase (ribokinase family)
VARLRALVCGHVTLDRFGERLLPGGAAYYAGRALRALGADVSILTSAGSDFPREALRGLAAEIVPARATTTFVNVHGPAGRTQRVLAAAPPLDASRLPAAARGADLVLLAPVLGETEPRSFLGAAAARTSGLGIQGLVRTVQEGGTVAQPPAALDGTALAGLDVIFAGEDDLRGQGDLARRLAAAAPIVVLTHGESGCELLVRGERRRVGVHPAREVDPTGAGDVFAAGFLFALARGDGPVEAARLGAAAASIVVEGLAGERLDAIGEAFARARDVPVVG